MCVYVAVGTTMAVALSMNMSFALSYKVMHSIIERCIQLQSDAISEFWSLTIPM
jgi:hypothetical protein